MAHRASGLSYPALLSKSRLSYSRWSLMRMLHGEQEMPTRVAERLALTLDVKLVYPNKMSLTRAA